MKILFIFLILQFFFSFLIFNVKNKWFWKWCLVSNIVLHNLILYFLITFNKLHIGYQNIYSINLSYTGREFLIAFGYDGISILFIWLTIFVTTLCILIAKNREFKQVEYLLILLLIQFILIVTFSTLDLFVFFFFLKLPYYQYIY